MTELQINFKAAYIALLNEADNEINISCRSEVNI